MDEGDDYVPQISQLESDDGSGGGFSFVGDLSQDAYVPPPPTQYQQQQHQAPAAFYPGSGGNNPTTMFAPPPMQQHPHGHMLPPQQSAVAVSKPSKAKKKKQPAPTTTVRSAPTLQAPGGHFGSNMQQQSAYSAQWAASYGSGQQQQQQPLRQPYHRAEFIQQQNSTYPAPGQQYASAGYPNAQAQMQQQTNPYYNTQSPAFYAGGAGQQQQQRMAYPRYPSSGGGQQQAAPYYQQQPAQFMYPTQQQQPERYGQQQPSWISPAYPSAGGSSYSGALPGANYQMQQQQQQQQQRFVNPSLQWSQLHMELTTCQEQLHSLEQQPPTGVIQQRMQSLQQRIGYIQCQIQNIHNQQQQQNVYNQQSQQQYPSQQQQQQLSDQYNMQNTNYSGGGNRHVVTTSMHSPELGDSNSTRRPINNAQTPPPPIPSSANRLTTTSNQPPPPSIGTEPTTVVSSYRGPEVQVNIKPEGTTLISVYQYPNSSAPPPVSTAAVATTQQLVSSSASDHRQHQHNSNIHNNFGVPPEPVPPAPKPTVTIADPKQQQQHLSSNSSTNAQTSPILQQSTKTIALVRNVDEQSFDGKQQKSPSPPSPPPVVVVVQSPPIAALPPAKIDEPEQTTPARRTVEKTASPKKSKIAKKEPRIAPSDENAIVKDDEEEADASKCSIEMMKKRMADEESGADETSAVQSADETSAAETPTSSHQNKSTNKKKKRPPLRKKPTAPDVSTSASKRAKVSALLYNSMSYICFRYPAKKTRSRKRKRPSYESEASGDETKKDEDEEIVDGSANVNISIDDIPDSLVEKRRSSRVIKQKRYMEVFPNLSDEEHILPEKEEDDAPKIVDSLVVEKIMLIRTIPSPNEDEPPIEEFYVKYKNLSYLHCDWKSQIELEKGDRRVVQKIKRFKQRREHATTILDEQYDEDEPFNPDYIQVERVLDVRERIVEEEEEVVVSKNHDNGATSTDAMDQIEKATEDEQTKKNDDDSDHENNCAEMKTETDTKEIVASNDVDEKTTKEQKVVIEYLVKWRSLQYEESTWELEKDVDKDKIAQFEARRYPKMEYAKERSRPHPSEWKKMDERLFKNGNCLRDYQVEGLNWLLFCWYNRQNCILADEMGLGKTVQTITFLIKAQEHGVNGPFLIVAPLSTIQNWYREFETWSSINAVIYHGTALSRAYIADYEMYYHDEQGNRLEKPLKFDALITTFEMILADEELKKINFRMCIIDEAHRLKNRNCKLLTDGFSAFKMEHRVLLTGTPLQNNVDELFSLLNFLEPKQFANSQAFLVEFGQCQTDEQVTKLQDILKPMMLRRLKEDVEKALKPKEETIIEIELSNIQKKYYRAILERNFSHLCKKGASAPSLMNTMMELRKCCNHPFLINGAEQQIVSEYRQQQPQKDFAELTHLALIQSSGKLVLIDKLLAKLRIDGHKVLVFSQMVRVLDLIEEFLVHMKYPFERIDGNVRGDLRQAAIDRFSRPDSDRFVFLLCTRAGGLGINLTAADTVIIFDSDWNPQNDLQAQARCHRIGQTKSVKVYRLISKNTYEREMFDKASMKLGLDKAVLQSTGTKENMAAQLSKKEVEELLRKGAYGAVMDETNESSKFSEEDIDTILQRRTQTITIQPGVKGSTFAKASFNVSSNREDIDVNDPNFWAKWAKKANIDTEFNPAKELIIYEPRQRKRRFEDSAYKNMEVEETDSESDEEDSTRKGGRKGRVSKRRHADDITYTPDELAFNKGDYFKVEKNVSIFGWGRWRDIRTACDLKHNVSDLDIQHMCRTLLLHCVREFSGDEKVRDFCWELITPVDAETLTPNAATRKTPTKKQRREAELASASASTSAPASGRSYRQGWAALPAYNPPSLAVDLSYQRHLQRHANKVLLRIHLLYFLHHDIIGALADRVLADVNADELDLVVPWHPELPIAWWDADADKSLLLGIYKHGFENYSSMRNDAALCFLKRCGPSADDAEMNGDDGDDQKTLSESIKTASSSTNNTTEASTTTLLPFPTKTDLTGRFRRLITLYQRSSKRQVQEQQKAKKTARQVQIQTLLQERQVRRLEERQRWTRREETDFYRTLMSYGVEQDADTGEYRWATFKKFARLETKFDATLTDYLTSMLAMCKRVCKRPLSAVEESLAWMGDSFSDERASKLIERVSLMTRVRAALKHPKRDERLALCNSSAHMPVWWQCGLKHDLDLLIGIARHGIAKANERLMNDTELSFLTAVQAHDNDDRANVKTTTDDDDEKDSTTVVVKKESSMEWPKERLMLFRLQDLCALIEQGEWPMQTAARLMHVADLEQQQSTPSDTPRSTPSSSLAALDDPRGDTPSSSLFGPTVSAAVVAPPQSQLSQSSKNRRGRRPKPAATLLTSPSTSSTSANPLHDLMEAEKEKMRALMHQSFLQQIEHLPFAAAMAASGGFGGGAGAGALQFPTASQLQELGLASLFGLTSSAMATTPTATTSTAASSSKGAVMPSSSSSSKRSSSSAQQKSLSIDQALNLSVKGGASAKTSENKEKVTKRAAVTDEGMDLTLNQAMALVNLPPDTRLPVINRKDGTRLTGANAPTMRSIAQWLSAHPNYVVDVPNLTPQHLDDFQLEPGEIPKSKQNTERTSKTTVDEQPHINVINRKTRVSITGKSAPSLKNLVNWLDKNPDWDIDSASIATIAKAKMKLPDKFKTRISSVESSKSTSSSTTTNPTTTTSSASSIPTISSSASSSMFDPFSNLFPPGTFDAAAQLQMLMQPFNPALLGMGLGGGTAGFPAFPFAGMMPSLSSMQSSAPVAATSSPSPATPSSSNNSKHKESKKSTTDTSPSHLGMSAKDAAMFVDNPFLMGLGANQSMNGLFNPFLAGMMQQQPGAGAANLAALAQLQSLMGMQGFESLLNAAAMQQQPTPSTSHTTTPSKSRSTTTTTTITPKTTPVTNKPTVAAASSSNRTKSSSKLNALVDKLAKTKSPEPRH